MIEHNRPGPPSVTKGFTIIDLLVALAIMVILASLAVPSYRNLVARSVRAQAKNALLNVADRQEQFFLDNKTYAAELTALGFGANPLYLDRDGFETGAESAERVYRIELTDTGAITYTVSAVPQLHQQEADTACGTLSVTHNGERSNSGPSGRCW